MPLHVHMDMTGVLDVCCREADCQDLDSDLIFVGPVYLAMILSVGALQ